MGHTAHWRKQFKSIDTYDYTITLIKRRKKTFLTLLEFIGSSFEETWIPFTQGCLVPNLVEIGPVVWRRRFFNFVNVFSLFRNYLPFEKGGALHLIKIESPSPKDALCQVWLKLAHWFWRRRWKCEKFTDRQTDRQTTDDRWSEKLTWAFSSGELKMKSSKTNIQTMD